MFTGYLPTPAIQHPSIGAVMSEEFGPRKNLPAYVAVPNVPLQGGTGYLSSKFGAFELGADPGQKNFQVRDISLPKGMTEERFDRRRTAREALEDHFRQVEANPAELDAMGEFYQQAYKLISSPEARKAFSLDGEPESMTKLYGEYKNPRGGQIIGVGRQLMLARRLVEAGVRLVTVMYNGTDGWDNHQRVKEAVSNGMPAFDHAFAGLITDLDQRGLLDSTLVMVTIRIRPHAQDQRERRPRSLGARLFRWRWPAAASRAARSTAHRAPLRANPIATRFRWKISWRRCTTRRASIRTTGCWRRADRPIDIVRDGNVVQGLIG